MTREEAVNWIINITADIGKAEHRDLWQYEQALYEIRELLEEQPEHDCNTCRYNDLEWHEEPCESCTGGGVNNHWKPSAQPEQRWIPCSKTPDTDRNVFIARGKQNFMSVCIGHYDHDFKQWYEDRNWFAKCLYDGLYWCEVPTLPEPYGGEQE